MENYNKPFSRKIADKIVAQSPLYKEGSPNNYFAGVNQTKGGILGLGWGFRYYGSCCGSCLQPATADVRLTSCYDTGAACAMATLMIRWRITTAS